MNGLIPARADNLTQTSATLAEWHDLVRKTGFNVFASQGDQKRIMQETTMAVINRKVDADIIAQLDTASVQVSATAATASVKMVAHAKTILGVNEVDTTEADSMFAVVSPAFMAYLQGTTEFSSADYVDVKTFSGPARRFLRWYGINWIEHPNVTGVGTSSEKCYLFHRKAIGHAVDRSGMKSPVGYDDEQDYSWARCSVFMGSKLLQSSGIVQMLHDGSEFAAA